MLNKQNSSKKTGSERVREARKRSQKRGYMADINMRAVAVLIAAFIILVLIVISGLQKVGKFLKSSKVDGTEVTTEIADEKLKKQITIDEIDITGMKMSEAKAAIDKVYPWKLTVHIGDDLSDSLVLDNILDTKVTKLLNEIYADVDNAASHYEINFDDVDIDSLVEKAKEKWNINPVNGSISGFNKETKSFTYADESDGYLIDEERLKSDLKSYVSRKNFEADISVVRNEVKASISAAKAKEMYKVIGTFTTKTTDNKDRNTNISLASEALDGLIIKPGEEFSFNNTTGNRTLERGYKPAGAYVNGVLSEEPGGGVCQVSSTLYNAVIFSGLKTTERHAHSFEPSYVTPGEDAMVSYDGYAGPDMKFINTSDTAIAIRAVLTGQTLTCSIIGIPILEEGVTVEMSSKKISDLNPPIPEYIEDKSLKKGKQVVVTEAKKGSRWATTYIVKKDGVLVKEEPFHNSTYKGKPAKIKVNSESEETSASKSNESSVSSTESTSSAHVNQTTSAVSTQAESTGEKTAESTTKKKDSGSSESTVEKLSTEEKSTKAKETKESAKPAETSSKPKESTKAKESSKAKESTKAKETTAEPTVEKLTTTEAAKTEETVEKLEN